MNIAEMSNNMILLEHIGYGSAVFLNITYLMEVWQIGRKDHRQMVRIDWIALVVCSISVALLVDSWCHFDMTLLKLAALVGWNLSPVIFVSAITRYAKPSRASCILEWMFAGFGKSAKTAKDINVNNVNNDNNDNKEVRQ